MSCDKLIISDIHAGLLTSRWRAIPTEIEKCNPKQVILVGDVIDSAPFEPIDPWLNILSDMAKEREFIWVRGNHDWLLGPPLANKTKIPCVEWYPWHDINGINLCIHGHQFDSMIVDHPELSAVATQLYAWLQELTGTTMAEYLKYISKTVSRDANKIQAGAVTYARNESIDNIFCGHVHSIKYDRVGSINYYNDGCTCSTTGNYFTIADDGFIELQEF